MAVVELGCRSDNARRAAMANVPVEDKLRRQPSSRRLPCPSPISPPARRCPKLIHIKARRSKRALYSGHSVKCEQMGRIVGGWGAGLTIRPVAMRRRPAFLRWPSSGRQPVEVMAGCDACRCSHAPRDRRSAQKYGSGLILLHLQRNAVATRSISAL